MYLLVYKQPMPRVNVWSIHKHLSSCLTSCLIFSDQLFISLLPWKTLLMLDLLLSGLEWEEEPHWGWASDRQSPFLDLSGEGCTEVESPCRMRKIIPRGILIFITKLLGWCHNGKTTHFWTIALLSCLRTERCIRSKIKLQNKEYFSYSFCSPLRTKLWSSELWKLWSFVMYISMYDHKRLSLIFLLFNVQANFEVLRFTLVRIG